MSDHRDREDAPRDGFMRDLDLPRRELSELVVDRGGWTMRSCSHSPSTPGATRQRDRQREELTFARMDQHADATDELDVQGILAFAERILPRASDLWVQVSLDYKQRLQQLFFPQGIAFDGNRFNRTAATAPLATTWRRLTARMKSW